MTDIINCALLNDAALEGYPKCKISLEDNYVL